MTHTINCRAQICDDCLDGKPTAVQFFGEDLPLTEDGTFRGFDKSIVCDPCYVKLVPLTPSGHGLVHELDEATAKAWWDRQKDLAEKAQQAFTSDEVQAATERAWKAS